MKNDLFLILMVSLSRLTRALLGKRRDQEILLLRKQVQVLQRQVKKPKLTTWDRMFFSSLYHGNKSLADKFMLLKPSTLMSWHSKFVKKKWDYSDRKVGRPPVTKEHIKLILEMKAANPRWGCRKIQGELRKLKIKIGKTKISEILRENGYNDPDRRKFERTWMNFMSAHAKRFFSCDFMVIDTLFLKRLYLFSVMENTTRRIVAFNITANPTRMWVENVIRSAFCFEPDLPGYMVSDRDRIYGDWFGDFLDEMYDITFKRIPPRCPNCNAHIERWHRTLRQEVLDHCLVFGRRDLHKIISEFVDYYHNHRPHQGLDQNAPLKDLGSLNTSGKIKRRKMVDGVITNFYRAA